MRIIRVMCTGRVDLSFIVRAFARGADGVLIAGCWPGECHYVTEGNLDALGTVLLTKELLGRIGLAPERLRVEWVGASEGTRFAEIMSDFSAQLKTLGPWRTAGAGAPSPVAAGLDRLAALVPYIKLVQREKLQPPGRKAAEIEKFYASHVSAVVDGLIADKLTNPEPAAPLSSPCQLGCPIGTEAWRYVAHIERGEYEKAYQAIREANPFPSVCARVCDHKCERSCRLNATGQAPVAIRALKRFVTDTIDPRSFQPARSSVVKPQKVAVVGAGPAGLSAAHLLSLRGYPVTLYDASDKPGGMLRLGIPGYRLPRDVLDREIAALLDDHITLKLGVRLGTDLTIDQLFAEGFAAVFLALGSLKSLPLGIHGEDATGVVPSLRFLSEFNLLGRSLARGKIGVIGGGNSAIDAARIALRQPEVEQVTLIYRRTREEMPAFADEIDAAIEEGAGLRCLLTPASVETSDGAITGLTCLKNELGPRDKSGRRRPVPIAGSEHLIALDTLIVAVSEKPDLECVEAQRSDGAEVKLTQWGSIEVDPVTLATSREGLFAGGDVVTGPGTVVEAIAAGKRAAVMIDRFLLGQQLQQPGDGARVVRDSGSAPARLSAEATGRTERLAAPHRPASERRTSADEVEQVVTEKVARCEAARCLRCDRELDCSSERGAR